MPRYFMELLAHSPQRFGTLLALIGVLVLTPDTLVIRLSGLERWALMGWRGILMGAMSLLLWRLLLSHNARREWQSLASWQGILVITAFSMNSATSPLALLKHRQPWF